MQVASLVGYIEGGCWLTKAACMQLQEQSEGQVPLSIGGNSGLNQNLEALGEWPTAVRGFGQILKSKY